ncbi:hypothetical protein [Demequina sp. NBRC 110054]|uniref:hypothetical protein n=1 Tax=Demequina sp. NBRC 110054 TaxID=1570343 RepID=UPI001178C2D8|nr:hypothetical protein [Demequina sp. NBRC 110054]
MRSDTVITLSLRHWTRRDHARFWIDTLAPSLAAAVIGLTTAATILIVAGTEEPRALATAALIATCGLAFPTAVAWNVSRFRAPSGFDVVRSELPSTEYVAD